MNWLQPQCLRGRGGKIMKRRNFSLTPCKYFRSSLLWSCNIKRRRNIRGKDPDYLTEYVCMCVCVWKELSIMFVFVREREREREKRAKYNYGSCKRDSYPKLHIGILLTFCRCLKSRRGCRPPTASPAAADQNLLILKYINQLILKFIHKSADSKGLSISWS